MITVQLGDLEGVLRGLGSIMYQKVPVKTAYRLSRLVKKLQDEHKNYEELRLRLCTEHCKKDEAGKPIVENGKFTGLDEQEVFRKAFEELRSLTIEVDFEPMTSAFLEEIGVTLSGADVLALGEFLSE
jgi:hypothetical protein